MLRLKIVYWALVGVLLALALFLVAAATRVMRGRRGPAAPGGG
jgi:hypothetical protein